MQRAHLLILLMPFLIIFSSCGQKMVLNKQVIQENRMEDALLDHIQWYNSMDIILTRYSNAQKEKSASKGTVTIASGVELERIIIKANTPGKIVQHLEGNKIAVSFEEDESKYLIFGPDRSSGQYVLQAPKWNESRAVIPYGNETFHTNTGISSCRLLFRMKKEYKQTTTTRVAKGKKV